MTALGLADGSLGGVPSWYSTGHEAGLDVYRRPVERVAALLVDAGFSVTARLVREPGPDEATPQGFLLVHRAD